MEIYRRVLDIGYSSNCSSWEKWDTSHSFSQYSSGWIRDSLDGYWRFMNHLVRIHVTWHARGDITCKCRLGRGYDILMACRQVEAFTFHRTRSINPRDFLCLFSFFPFFFSFSPAESRPASPRLGWKVTRHGNQSPDQPTVPFYLTTVSANETR